MEARDYFPLGVATGAAFCNRQQETNLLINNIKSVKHCLLMATRRYGKSSLALHALELSRLPYVELDFYMATSDAIVESYLLNGIVDLIGKALGPIDKLLASIKKYVKHLKPKLEIGATFLKLELSTEAKSDPATNVKEGLMLLEKLLTEKKQPAILLLDEFQMVGILAEGKGIEAAIRHVAQKTRYLTLIFSGSNRKMLQTMFEDENRPLYKLCWKINIDKIAAEHYQIHLQKAAKLAWKKELNKDAFIAIMTHTDRHPYYVNKLCDKLWTYYNTSPPSARNVDTEWNELLQEEKSDAIKEISLLSLGQKKILQQIAKAENTQLTSKNTILELHMSSSSNITALNGLEEKDIIGKIADVYQVINPIIKYYASQG